MLSGDMNLGTDGDVDMDDRQLSADLDSRLKIQEDGGDLKPRATGGSISPKQEKTFAPCRFTGLSSQDHALRNATGELGQHSTFNQNQSYGLQQQKQASWNQYRQPPSSLSSDLDLDTDKDLSIFPESKYVPPSEFLQNRILQKGSFQNNQNYDSEVIQPPHFELPLQHRGCQGHANTYPHGHAEFKPEIGIPSGDSYQQCQTPQDTSQDIQNAQLHMSVGGVSMKTDQLKEPLIIEPDEQGECALHLLSVVDDKSIMAEVLDTLLRCGVVEQCINLQNKAKQTPLFLAVQTGNIPLIGWLLQYGADPNIQGTVRQDRDVYVWRGPLHLAATIGDAGIGMLRMLIQAGADINAFTIAERLTPLHVALKCHSATLNCRHTILELIKEGAMNASISEQSSSKTPLIMAIETRDSSLVHDILEQFDAAHCRALLQEQTRSGDTCLHIAAGMSRISSQQKQFLLRMLIIKGANGNIANNIKEFPRDYARFEWDKVRTFNT